MDFVLIFFQIFQVDKQVIFTYVNSTSLAVLFANFLGLSLYTKSSSKLSTISETAYGIFIQILEPLLMLIELLQVIRYIMDIGEQLRDKIFESYENYNKRTTVALKTLTLSVSIIVYSIVLFMSVNIIRSESFVFST